MIRSKSSVFEASALKCMVSLPLCFFRIPTTQSTDTLEYWMSCVFESSHHLSGCGVTFSLKCARKSSIPLLFLSRGSRIVKCPCKNLFANSMTFSKFEIQIPSFPSVVQSMSLYIDMKMIRSVNFSGSMFLSRKSSEIFWRICNFEKSWENTTLEINCFSIDSQQFFVRKETFWTLPLDLPIFQLHLRFLSFSPDTLLNRLDHETILILSMEEMHCQSYSHSESLQNAPISIFVWYWLSSEFPRSSCFCRPPGSPNNSVQDEWRLSSMKP